LNFNFVIMEIFETAGNGSNFISSIRRSKTAFTARTPIAGYAEQITPDLVIAVRDAGISEIMVKPFSSGVLLKKLNSMLFSPRPFIQNVGYSGPSRRRKDNPVYIGPRRREADKPSVIEKGQVDRAMAEEEVTTAISQEELLKRVGKNIPDKTVS